METIMQVNGVLNGFIWGPIMLTLLVGTGVYYSLRIGFPQFRFFGHAMKNTVGKIFEKTEAGEGEITPFQAVSTALASTVGTGNIAGVTAAVVIGGPGAVFWMLVSALFGMCTKFAEVTLAVKYREKNDKGDWVGGPMYYIKNGMGAKWKWLGGVFAVLGALACFGIGNMTQVNSMASTVFSVAQAFGASESAKFTVSLITGIVVAVFVFITLLGGIKGIAGVTEKLVPFMAVVYIVCALIVVIANAKAVPGAIKDIFVCAFNPAAAGAGFVGVTIKTVITKGVARGVFSNEAGLGSAPIAHSATAEKNPVKQGLYGIFEVFCDTIVICTLTALCSITTGTYALEGAEAGAGTAVAAFQTVLGDKAGSIILAVGLFCFALSTILGWSLYGVRCAEYLFGSKVIKPYQILFCIVVVVGAVAEVSVVWDIADTLNGFMALPNLVALLVLSPVCVGLAKEYFAGVKAEKK